MNKIIRRKKKKEIKTKRKKRRLKPKAKSGYVPEDGKKKNITGDKINNIFFKKYVKKNKIKLTKRNGGNKIKNIKKRGHFFFFREQYG